jgi:predicted esterase
MLRLRLLDRLFLALTLLALTLPGGARAATAADFVARTGPNGGLPYRLLVPAGYQPAQKYPLILFFHGADEYGTDNQKQLANNANGALALVSDAAQASAPVFMVAPQAPTRGGFRDASVRQKVQDILDALLLEFPGIDVERLYLTGLSQGGLATWDYLFAAPSTFAAAVPMSGGGGDTERGSVVAHLPIWAFHAANDSSVVVGSSDAIINAVRAAGGSVIYTRYATGGHPIWPVAYAHPGLREWLLSHRRGVRSSLGPVLTITAPTDAATLVTPASSISLAGSASGGASAITQVTWKDKRLGGGTLSGTATGTTAWSTAGIAILNGVTHVLTVQAESPSEWPAYGGATTFNDVLTVTRGSDTPPTVSITGPTAATTWTTSALTLDLVGSAADASGITQVTWSNDRGGSSTATGTTSWSASGVPLLPGVNILTVTARDTAGQTATDTLTVTVNVPPAQDVVFAQDFQSSFAVADYVSASAPGVGQFNDVSAEAQGGTWSITPGGRLQLQRTGSNATDNDATVTRHTDLAGPTSVLDLSFSLSVSGWTASTYQSAACVLEVGRVSGVTDGNLGLPATDLFQALAIQGRGAGSFAFVLNGVPSTTFRTDGTAYAVRLLLNHSGAARSYVGPDGSSRTLDADHVALWVDGVLLSDNVSATAGATSALTDFRMRWSQPENGTWTVDDFVARSSLP